MLILSLRRQLCDDLRRSGLSTIVPVKGLGRSLHYTQCPMHAYPVLNWGFIENPLCVYTALLISVCGEFASWIGLSLRTGVRRRYCTSSRYERPLLST